jgi:hypothetical protein
MSEMQSKNRRSQAADSYGNRDSNRCSLLYVRILAAGISEIVIIDRISGRDIRVQYAKENPETAR